MTTPNEKTGYWKRVWAKHPDSMAENLRKLNESRKRKSSERMALLKAILAQMPIGPMTSTELRDQVREAWNSTYGESISKPDAWNLVRAGRSAKVIPEPDATGSYVIHPLPQQDA